MLLPARPAAAHTGGDPDVRVVLDPLPDALAGLQVQVADRLAFQLVVANPTETVVEVLGLDGRPYLRLRPDGVEANLAVADWYTTNDPVGATRVPDDVGGADRWTRISAQPSWGWYDHRLHPGAVEPPAELVAAGTPADFGEWSVPVTVDGRPVEITGTYRYQPRRGAYAASVRTPPAAEDVTLVVLPGAVPGLFLDNTGSETVLVRGAAGEPFLRFDPAVGVEANLRSRSWLESARAAEGTTPEELVDDDAEPLWEVVSTAPRLGWIDQRTSLGRPEPDEDVVQAGIPAVVKEWTIPLEVGGRPQLVEGVTTWQPAADAVEPVDGPSEGTLRTLAVAAVAVIGVGGLVLTRRRARRSRPAAGPSRS